MARRRGRANELQRPDHFFLLPSAVAVAEDPGGLAQLRTGRPCDEGQSVTNPASHGSGTQPIPQSSVCSNLRKPRHDAAPSPICGVKNRARPSTFRSAAVPARRGILPRQLNSHSRPLPAVQTVRRSARERPVSMYCSRSPSSGCRGAFSKPVVQNLVVPAGTESWSNGCRSRKRTGTPDPIAEVQNSFARTRKLTLANLADTVPSRPTFRCGGRNGLSPV